MFEASIFGRCFDLLKQKNLVEGSQIVAIIPARGGSKRLKNKNIYPIWGKPMIYWAIKACKESKYDIEPWVSTDSKEIAEIAKSLGAKVHMRSKRLARDNTYKQVVIRSASKYINKKQKKPEIFISLQANSPQIKAEHLDNAIDTLKKYDRDEIFSVGSNLMQNAAFRIFKAEYVMQKDLSTNCGVFVCELHDVHTEKDVKILEGNNEYYK
jgi:CMP-N-acetylneuraminic acid synthetase